VKRLSIKIIYLSSSPHALIIDRFKVQVSMLVVVLESEGCCFMVFSIPAILVSREWCWLANETTGISGS
jgi:hypothetical protein